MNKTSARARSARGTLLWMVAVALTACSGDPRFEAPVISYENGNWWTGDGFEVGTRTVSAGTFVEASPAEVDSVVDLEGRWLVPPFGDAHTHNLDGDTTTAPRYLREGVFYVQVLTNTVSGAARVREAFAGPASIDIAYANAGISSEFGHPLLAYEPRAMGLDWTAYNERREEICRSRLMEGEAYFFIEDEAELEETWPRVVESSPDVLKIFLLRSEEPAPTGCERMGLTGMTPELAARVVEKAEEAGLRVWAHVESAADVRAAAEMGVFGLAHLPGYGFDQEDGAARNRLDSSTLDVVGDLGMYVAPTLQWLDQYGLDSATYASARALQRENLERWIEAGGKVVVGSDIYGQTARPEIDAFAALGLWTNAEIVRMWAQTTPRSIFPDRRIGGFEPGFEASWLSLECDPVARLTCVDTIVDRVKQGHALTPVQEVESSTPNGQTESEAEPQ